MRFVVTFAHRKYQDIMDALRQEDSGYRVPLGVYRQLAIVVEARTPEEAVDAAMRELGWPDDELALVPMGVASQDEVAENARRHGHALTADEAAEPDETGGRRAAFDAKA